MALMNPKTIKHIWFDFSETLAMLKKDRHNRLRYESYANAVHRSVDKHLIDEYEVLYEKYNHSNAAIFHSLGLPSDYWSERINSLAPTELYALSDPDIPVVLPEIRKYVPISIFSNIHVQKILNMLAIDPSWFTYTIDAGIVKEPKPSLEGFYKMIELSALPAENILYIGDHLGKDIRPAKKVGIQAGLMWQQSDEADYCFKKFQDVLDLLKRE